MWLQLEPPVNTSQVQSLQRLRVAVSLCETLSPLGVDERSTNVNVDVGGSGEVSSDGTVLLDSSQRDEGEEEAVGGGVGGGGGTALTPACQKLL